MRTLSHNAASVYYHNAAGAYYDNTAGALLPREVWHNINLTKILIHKQGIND
ncbi:MAG: hypothetical protein ACJARY_001920 [Candidatus Azotimanducaceae bacterium]|jgi:hypothetical protein